MDEAEVKPQDWQPTPEEMVPVADTAEQPESVLVPTAPPHDIIQTAQQILGEGKSLTNVYSYSGGDLPTLEPLAPPVSAASIFDKFPDVTRQLREDNSELGYGQGVDLFRVRKLNLAATIEALERAVNAHEAFPSADAGVAVAKLAEQASSLTKELEKSQDPHVMYSRIVEYVMEPLTAAVIKSLAEESKRFIVDFEYHIPEEKRQAFKESVKKMALRLGPSLQDALGDAKNRLLSALNLKTGMKMTKPPGT